MRSSRGVIDRRAAASCSIETPAGRLARPTISDGGCEVVGADGSPEFWGSKWTTSATRREIASDGPSSTLKPSPSGQRLHDLFHEERRTVRAFQNEGFQGLQAFVVAHEKGQQLARFFLAQGRQTQLRVIGLAAPLMAILGTVVHE